jgi:glutathione S-transferase
MIALYHNGMSTCSQKVRIALAEKGQSFESHHLDLRARDQGKPEYLKLNPNGVVPTLVHDGHAIINSLCINEYIDDAFPEPPLRPADLKDRARMRYWAWTADEVHLSLARLTHERLLKAAMKDLGPDELQIMLKSTPVPEKRERWNVLATGGYTPDQMQAALDNVLFIFKRVQEELSERGPWLAGKSFSLGDISMVAIVHRIFELYPDRLNRSDFPVLNDWWDRLMARPAAAYVYAEDTDEVPRRPAKKSIAGITEFHVAAE